MPYHLTLLQDSRLVFVCQWDTPEKEELLAFNEEFRAILDAAPHPLVHLILDCAAVTGRPNLQLRDMSLLTVGGHPRAGWTVLTGVSNPMMRVTTSIVLQLFGQRVRFVDTNAAALDFLNTVDVTLCAAGSLDADVLVCPCALGTLPSGPPRSMGH